VRTLTFVGHDEADPAEGLIAFASPLAQAIMGSEPDETIDLPGRDNSIRVISVEGPNLFDRAIGHKRSFALGGKIR
jgi:transcription elongation GreA/GreB family factor